MSSQANSDFVVRTEGRIAVVRERDKYGNDTGASFYRCRECGGEILTRCSKEKVHERGCPLRGDA